jgi:hypothetical protein
MKRYLVVLVLGAFAGCASVQEAPRSNVHHVVLCWLKDAGNVEHRRQIMDASRSFRNIPGVLAVRVGEAIDSDRVIVDDSFDVAVSLSFADEQSLAEYLAHPIHQKAKREILLPIVNKIVVYDFSEPSHREDAD